MTEENRKRRDISGEGREEEKRVGRLSSSLGWLLYRLSKNFPYHYCTYHVRVRLERFEMIALKKERGFTSLIHFRPCALHEC